MPEGEPVGPLLGDAERILLALGLYAIPHLFVGFSFVASLLTLCDSGKSPQKVVTEGSCKERAGGNFSEKS